MKYWSTKKQRSQQQEHNTEEAMQTGEPTCVICIEALAGRLGVCNPCGHVFHQECFASWDLERYDEDRPRQFTACPSCRQQTTSFTHIHEPVASLKFGELSSNIPVVTPTASMDFTTVRESHPDLYTTLVDLRSQVASLEAIVSSGKYEAEQNQTRQLVEVTHRNTLLQEELSHLTELVSHLQSENEELSQSLREGQLLMHDMLEDALVSKSRYHAQDI